ncbi:MAG: B-box zinc finger protein [Candidatus Promineifilaceae bacterium]
METLSPRIRSLLRQANKVAASGKRSASTKLYQQIIDEAPETVGAWVGLAGVLRTQDEKEAALGKALELDPENPAATRALAILNGETLEEPEIAEREEVPEETPDDEPVNQELANDISLTAEQTETEFISSGQSNETLSTEIVEDTGPIEEDEHNLEFVGEVLYCANHPKRETHLRCNRCGKPICTNCAQRTPVGYRCPECIREHEEIFYSATPIDYVIAVLIALPLGLVAGYLATLVGFFVIFLAAAAGSFIGRLVLRAVGRRRGRWLPQMVGVIVVIGGILPAAPYLLGILFGSFGLSLSLLWSGIYVVMASGAAYYQLR